MPLTLGNALQATIQWYLARCHKGDYSLYSLSFALLFMPIVPSNLAITAPPIPGRRLYKKTKSRKEPIWPPLLETALVEGLPVYASQKESLTSTT